MQALLLLLVCLPSLAHAVTDCGGNPALGCFEDGDCATGITCTGGALAPAPVLGCCNVPTTTTTTTVATTAASSNSGSGSSGSSSTTCVDKVNPVTGTSDCGSKAYLCTDSNYRQVMIDQCPRTCGFCASTSSNSGTSSTTCVDLVNPRTGVSDCPAMRAYCNNNVYRSLMQVQCRATCGFCTSG